MDNSVIRERLDTIHEGSLPHELKGGMKSGQDFGFELDHEYLKSGLSSSVNESRFMVAGRFEYIDAFGVNFYSEFAFRTKKNVTGNIQKMNRVSIDLAVCEATQT